MIKWISYYELFKKKHTISQRNSWKWGTYSKQQYRTHIQHITFFSALEKYEELESIWGLKAKVSQTSSIEQSSFLLRNAESEVVTIFELSCCTIGNFPVVGDGWACRNHKSKIVRWHNLHIIDPSCCHEIYLIFYSLAKVKIIYQRKRK